MRDGVHGLIAGGTGSGKSVSMLAAMGLIAMAATGLAHDRASHVAYESGINQRAMEMRSRKLAALASTLRPPVPHGADEGELLVVGWGSTFGAISQAVLGARKAGLKVSHAHIRYMNPMPKNLGDLLRRFKKVLVPEMNNGMLVKMLRSEYLVDARGMNKIAGQPFKIAEIEAEIRAQLEK